MKEAETPVIGGGRFRIHQAAGERSLTRATIPSLDSLHSNDVQDVGLLN
jgi:hypothetical protein